MAYVLLHAGQPAARQLVDRVKRLLGTAQASGVTAGDVVIRWGNTRVADTGGWVLNPLTAVVNASNRRRMLLMLRQAGIRCPGSKSAVDASGRLTMIRTYRVAVFDGKPIGCFRTDGTLVWLNQMMRKPSEPFREVRMDEDKFTARAVDWAVKATRAVGLDGGLVTIGLTPRNLMTVLHVNPAPVLSGRLLEMFSTAISDFISDDEAADLVHSDVVLGTDVEFMLANRQGKMVLASKYFRRKGIVGCDDRSIRGDGQRLPLAELRPEPSSSPLQLVENLRQAMIQAQRLTKAPGVGWRAGSMPFPNYWIGGHVHFSKVPFNSRLVKALDTYLGLPVMMIENPATAQRRRPRYGFLGDIRHKEHGGFEYRTPGSFVVSPEITTAILCLAQVIATHYRQLPYLTPFTDPTLQRAFYTCNRQALLPTFQTAWEALSQTSTYALYRSQLSLIPSMVENGAFWNEDVDFRQTWGIVAEAKAPVRGTVRPYVRPQARLG